ncbi:helix-turn-helix transcriptional regulator [Mycolicibacterium duvalii]|nr:GAF domain-containing protein [Mycolicibacterium duvalii]PEG43848.1 helix-turn-helix transcriptional regulator [Mycolicibacterium duvalii]
MPPTLLRPRDGDAVRAALRDLAALGEVPILFGGPVYDDTLLLTEFVGTRTGNLRGLAVQPSSGLGGATMVAGRPMSVADYRHAVSITHDYDGPVLSEGIRAVLAVPVLVDGRTRAVLYGAHRSSAPFGGRTADRMVAVARSLGEELRIRDEVDRRMRLHETHTTTGGVAAGAEQIREVHAELRHLAAASPSPLQEQLRAMADRLAQALTGTTADTASLTSRELDVLAQVALGCTNSEAAQRLSLKPETVKAYLRSAAGKLGASTRYESVSKARRAGLLP